MSYPEFRMVCSGTTQFGRPCRQAAGKNGLCGRHSRFYGGSDVIDPLELADWSKPAETLKRLAKRTSTPTTTEQEDAKRRTPT